MRSDTPTSPVAEWLPVTRGNFYEWRQTLFPPNAYNSNGGFSEEPVVRVVLMRVPGKWERRVRCWSEPNPKPGYMVTQGGHPAMQVEASDACPLDRGPVVYLQDLAYHSSDVESSELAGLEWRDA